jgi:catecholate siderophore receptor
VPANTPKNSASLWTAYNFTREWQGGYRHRVHVEAASRPNTNAVEVDDYFRWDAMLAYQQPQWGVQLNVLNLTNRLAYDALIPSDRGRSVPGTNRQALLSFNYKFL